MSKRLRGFPLTLVAAVALALGLVGLVFTGSSLGFEFFGLLFLVSIPVLLVSAGSDARRGRYWGLGLIAFFVALGALLVWLVSHATTPYW